MGGRVALCVPSINSSSKFPEILYALPRIRNKSVFAKVNFGDSNAYVIGSIYGPKLVIFRCLFAMVRPSKKVVSCTVR